MRKWKTKEGKEIEIKDMETSHIKNCLNMLERKGFVSMTTLDLYLSCSDPNGEMAQIAFEQELMDLRVTNFIDLFTEELERGKENV